MAYEESNNLLEMYDAALKEYQTRGYHPHPANLLAMLLLPEKDKFEPLRDSEGKFYEYYKEEINSKIEKIITDFEISYWEIISFIERKGIYTPFDSFEHNKIWYVFAEGFGTMHWGIMYHPDQTDYQLYHTMDNKSMWYKMTPDGLEKYSTKRKNKKVKKKEINKVVS